jgi:hypothetical protein
MQISPGIAHLPSRLCLSDIRRCVAVQVLGFADNGLLTPQRRLVSASCSSGQRFAFGFLQIRSRPRHPCRSANSSPCRVSRGLSPPSKCALPGAPQKSPAPGWANPLTSSTLKRKKRRVAIAQTCECGGWGKVQFEVLTPIVVLICGSW